MTVLVIARLSAWDCASRSGAGIMWKLLFVLSCIITRRFWTVCPSCWALWSAKALSFPPDHEATSFNLFFLLFVRSWIFGVDGLSSFGYKGCCEGLCAQRLSESMGLVWVVMIMVDDKPALLGFLEQKGISLKELVDCGLELFVPHPGIETAEKATAILREELLDALADVNVSTLMVAAFRAQEDAENGLIPGLSQERFLGRPGLVADEVIGLAIASYIAGTRGIFEYTRFDQTKPGVLKKLGPITNDAVAALVASASSNMYTKALRKQK